MTRIQHFNAAYLFFSPFFLFLSPLFLPFFSSLHNGVNGSAGAGQGKAGGRGAGEWNQGSVNEKNSAFLFLILLGVLNTRQVGVEGMVCDRYEYHKHGQKKTWTKRIPVLQHPFFFSFFFFFLKKI